MRSERNLMNPADPALPAAAPLVSIIIPCYNAEKSVAETIRNALAQTWRNTEVIVVDDGSSDGSLAIIRSFGDRIRWVSGGNRGGCAARNTGLALARGDYIQFLDADDLMDPDKLARQLEQLRGRDWRAVAVCGVKLIDQAGREIARRPAPPAPSREQGIDFLLEMWLRGTGYFSHGWLCHRRLLDEVGGWNERLLADQDGEYFGRVLCAAGPVVFCEQVFVYYRRGNPHSVASRRSYLAARSRIDSMKILEAAALQKRRDDVAVQAIRNRWLAVAFYHIWYSALLAKYALARGQALDAPSGRMFVGNRGFRLVYSLFGLSVAIGVRTWVRHWLR